MQSVTEAPPAHRSNAPQTKPRDPSPVTADGPVSADGRATVGGRPTLGGRATVDVIGIGNLLLGDDGLGPAVVRRLEARGDPPPGVRFLDLGTPGLDLANWLLEADATILVDAVAPTGHRDVPGALITHVPESMHRAPRAPRVSPHDPAVHEAIQLAMLVREAPVYVWLTGLVPAESEVGIGLSPTVEAALPALFAEIERLIATARARVGVAGPTVERMMR